MLFALNRALLLICVIMTPLTLSAVAPTKNASPAQSVKRTDQPVTLLKNWLKLSPDKRPPVTDLPCAHIPLTRSQAQTARALLWTDHTNQITRTRRREWDSKQMTLAKFTMKYEYITYGKAPVNGHSLYVSLHGGGGAPPSVNDQQWRNQIQLYQPAEGIYLAPRAPTNDWDLWHKPHIDDFFDRIIENAIVFANVNPNRVYLMGYSAGGDGVYQLAGRMADRWAAASMMAGHPNDASPLGLRNVPFSLWVGAKDAAYQRNQIAKKWSDWLDSLQKKDPDGYLHQVHIQPGMGHWMNRTDAAALPWMAHYSRNPFPQRVVWKQDNVTHSRFYWLAVDPEHAHNNTEIIASRSRQTITIEKIQPPMPITIRLNDAMLDLDRPVTIICPNRPPSQSIIPRTIAAIAQSTSERGDPQSVFSAQITITPPLPPD